MATTKFKGNPVHTVGELPAVGSTIPAFTLAGNDLGDITSESLAGKKVIYNIFPSVDTGVCAASVRTFNKDAAGLKDATVVCVSKDLPFAQGRFCGAEGISDVTVASAFRSSFGEDFGVTQADGPMKGLLARSVVVADAAGKVVYTELVPEITTEPDYASALEAVEKA